LLLLLFFFFFLSRVSSLRQYWVTNEIWFSVSGSKTVCECCAVGCKDFSWWSEEEEEAEAEEEDDEVCCLVKWVIHRSMWEEPFVHLQVPHHRERERESVSQWL
jgi:hypothetical protein